MVQNNVGSLVKVGRNRTYSYLAFVEGPLYTRTCPETLKMLLEQKSNESGHS
jgi:hypothetical protein